MVSIYCKPFSFFLAVFNAIYLETLTRKELVEKISSLFSINPSQITESFVQQKKSSFLVMLTDDVSKFCDDRIQLDF